MLRGGSIKIYVMYLERMYDMNQNGLDVRGSRWPEMACMPGWLCADSLLNGTRSTDLVSVPQSRHFLGFPQRVWLTSLMNVKRSRCLVFWAVGQPGTHPVPPWQSRSAKLNAPLAVFLTDGSPTPALPWKSSKKAGKKCTTNAIPRGNPE